jgi:hypothetical protein
MTDSPQESVLKLHDAFRAGAAWRHRLPMMLPSGLVRMSIEEAHRRYPVPTPAADPQQQAAHAPEPAVTERWSPPFCCPVCNGAGHVSRPPNIPGDVTDWTAAGMESYQCRACAGQGFVWAPTDELESLRSSVASLGAANATNLATHEGTLRALLKAQDDVMRLDWLDLQQHPEMHLERILAERAAGIGPPSAAALPTEGDRHAP